MTYTSYAFLIFIVITTGIYYTVHKKRQWMAFLLSSIIFYICSGPVFLIWLLSFTFFTWYGAGKMEKSKTGRKAGLAVLIFMNIGVLFLLKWSGMELAFINRVFGTGLGWRVVLPMGMSSIICCMHLIFLILYPGRLTGMKRWERSFMRDILLTGMLFIMVFCGSCGDI